MDLFNQLSGVPAFDGGVEELQMFIANVEAIRQHVAEKFINLFDIRIRYRIISEADKVLKSSGSAFKWNDIKGILLLNYDYEKFEEFKRINLIRKNEMLQDSENVKFNDFKCGQISDNIGNFERKEKDCSEHSENINSINNNVEDNLKEPIKMYTDVFKNCDDNLKSTLIIENVNFNNRTEIQSVDEKYINSFNKQNALECTETESENHIRQEKYKVGSDMNMDTNYQDHTIIIENTKVEIENIVANTDNLKSVYIKDVFKILNYRKIMGKIFNEKLIKNNKVQECENDLKACITNFRKGHLKKKLNAKAVRKFETIHFNSLEGKKSIKKLARITMKGLNIFNKNIRKRNFKEINRKFRIVNKEELKLIENNYKYRKKIIRKIYLKR